jgi:hypothetical protein
MNEENGNTKNIGIVDTNMEAQSEDEDTPETLTSPHSSNSDHVNNRGGDFRYTTATASSHNVVAQQQQPRLLSDSGRPLIRIPPTRDRAEWVERAVDGDIPPARIAALQKAVATLPPLPPPKPPPPPPPAPKAPVHFFSILPAQSLGRPLYPPVPLPPVPPPPPAPQVSTTIPKGVRRLGGGGAARGPPFEVVLSDASWGNDNHPILRNLIEQHYDSYFAEGGLLNQHSQTIDLVIHRLMTEYHPLLIVEKKVKLPRPRTERTVVSPHQVMPGAHYRSRLYDKIRGCFVHAREQRRTQDSQDRAAVADFAASPTVDASPATVASSAPVALPAPAQPTENRTTDSPISEELLLCDEQIEPYVDPMLSAVPQQTTSQPPQQQLQPHAGAATAPPPQPYPRVPPQSGVPLVGGQLPSDPHTAQVIYFPHQNPYYHHYHYHFPHPAPLQAQNPNHHTSQSALNQSSSRVVMQHQYSSNFPPIRVTVQRTARTHSGHSMVAGQKKPPNQSWPAARTTTTAPAMGGLKTPDRRHSGSIAAPTMTKAAKKSQGGATLTKSGRDDPIGKDLSIKAKPRAKKPTPAQLIPSKSRKYINGIPEPMVSVDKLTYDWSSLKLDGAAAWNAWLKQKLLQDPSRHGDVPQVTAMDTFWLVQNLKDSLRTIPPPKGSSLHRVDLSDARSSISSPAAAAAEGDFDALYPHLSKVYQEMVAQDCISMDRERVSRQQLEFQYMTADQVREHLVAIEQDVTALAAQQHQVVEMAQEMGLFAKRRRVTKTDGTSDFWQPDFAAQLSKSGEASRYLMAHDQF